AIGHLVWPVADPAAIYHSRLHAPQSQLSHPAGHGLDLCWMNVAGDDATAIAHALGDVGRLSPRRCARIDDRLTWLRVEEVCDEHGAEVLHGEHARLRQAVTDLKRALQPESFGEHRRRGGYAGGRKLGGNRIAP